MLRYESRWVGQRSRQPIVILPITISYGFGNRGFLHIDRGDLAYNWSRSSIASSRLDSGGPFELSSIVPPHLPQHLLYGFHRKNYDPLAPDEFQRSIHATSTTVAKDDTCWNPIKWWADEALRIRHASTICIRPFILSCYGYSMWTTIQRSKRTLTPERNALGVKVLEACGCLHWW